MFPRLLLVLVIAAALLLGASPASVATPTGADPESAVELVGMHSTTLPPGGQFWYRFTGNPGPIRLLLYYDPAPQVSNPRVTFKVWIRDNKTEGRQLIAIGQGTVGPHPVGVKFWRGDHYATRDYWVQVVNGMDNPTSYALAFVGENGPWALPIRPVAAPTAAPPPPPAVPTPVPPPAVVVPATPGPSGAVLEEAIDLTGTQYGTLTLGQSRWYRFWDRGGQSFGILMNYFPTPIESDPNVVFKIWVWDSETLAWSYKVIGQGTTGGRPVGVKYWRGNHPFPRNYWLQVYNGIDLTISYAIANIGERESLPTLMTAQTGIPAPTPVPVAPTPTVAAPTPTAMPSPTATPMPAIIPPPDAEIPDGA